MTEQKKEGPLYIVIEGVNGCFLIGGYTPFAEEFSRRLTKRFPRKKVLLLKSEKVFCEDSGVGEEICEWEVDAKKIHQGMLREELTP